MWISSAIGVIVLLFLPSSQGACDEQLLRTNLGTTYKDCTQKSNLLTLLDTVVTNVAQKCNSAKQDLQKCLDDYETPFRPCLDSTQRRSMDTFRASRTAYVDAICKDNGNQLKEFWNKGGTNCIKNSSGRNRCANPHLIIFKFNETICNTQKTYLDCFNTMWDHESCQPFAKTFLYSSTKASVDSTPCYRYVNSAKKKKVPLLVLAIALLYHITIAAIN